MNVNSDETNTMAIESSQNPPASVGGTGEMGSTPGSGRSLAEEMATYSSILAWKIPWTEEFGGTVHGVTKSWT